jgi:gliding motility-associated protein GldM
MSGAKETPRQKMIGMMYLVYTALLAMNVSKDILNAFDIVNTGVQETNVTIAARIDNQYDAIKKNFELESGNETAIENWNKAQALQQKSTELINYIENDVKWALVSKVEGLTVDQAVEKGLIIDKDVMKGERYMYNINTSKIGTRDNYNDPTAFMLGSVATGNEGKGPAYDLANKIREYRKFIEDEIYQGEGQVIGLDVKEGTAYHEGADDKGDGITWEQYNFYHTVLPADVTLLNKIVSEVQNAESAALTKLSNFHENDFTFDSIGAKVLAESSYIITGQEYRADALVTAWKNEEITAHVLVGSNANEDAIMSQGTEIKSENGTIKLRFPAGGVGEKEYHGIIEMLDPKTKEMVKYPFSGKYTVAAPSVTISPTKMNVVYSGIDNPISVSAAGFANNKVSVSAPGASLSRTGDGNYMLKVTDGNAKTIKITASAEGRALGSVEMRVKPLPKPTARIENVGADGKVGKSALIAAGRIIAEMKDFDFEGVSYNVVGYTMKYKTKSGSNKETKVEGGKFSGEILSVLNGAQTGDMYVFTAIRVRGNDNKEKVLDNAIAVEIK